MTMTIEEITTVALELPASLRAELVERLLASLHDAGEIHSEWPAELDRRDAELNADPSLARPSDDVFRRLRARLAE